ncbi:hypothetical protein FEM48_Zijuj08G0129900 [Ziziphus jujuba var. spinosa]|uniref:Uncharacterized protein n=1 Tax=Ziziphus jujuba var. spinosa TaxID=714518 RepID=A0A978UZ88_ZIZJJ|nr:hypothetical protein FEM48_Zijuj08G0129900 [Ziziphus jujuba var. spinosa]
MPGPNGVFLRNFVIILVSASVFSQNWLVFGSAVQEQSFKRPDPLRFFKYYNGDFDVQNKHYWASTALTGVHGYAIAGVWLLCGMVFGIFMTFKHPNMKSWAISEFLEHYYITIFLLVLLFTFLALVSSSLVLSANQDSLKKMENLRESIENVGKDARRTIRKVVEAMTTMESLLVPYNSDMAKVLRVTSHQLGKASLLIQSVVHNIGASIHKAIQTSYIAHLVVVIFNLVLVVAALVLILTHWYPGFVIIIFLCWILTTFGWVLTGFDFFFHNFIEDTCAALEDVKLNPQNNSLSSVLPCMDPSYSQKIMVQIGSTVHIFISQLNSKAEDFYKMFGLDEQNENLYGVIQICNPFKGPPEYSYVPEGCPKNSIPISQIPNNNINEGCKSSGRVIPEASYNMARDYSEAIQDLLDIYPELKSLTECKLVKQFSNVVLQQCKSIRAAIRWLWVLMLFLSISMVALVLTWVAKAFQDRGRSFSMCSISPG